MLLAGWNSHMCHLVARARGKALPKNKVSKLSKVKTASSISSRAGPDVKEF